jgi:hypothetical protein
MWMGTPLVLVLTLAVGPARVYGQPPAADIQKMQTLLTATTYTSTRLNHPTVAVWTIARQGEHIGTFEIRVTTVNGIVATFVTVARKNKIRKTAELMENFLKLDQDYDYVKVAFDDDGDAFVRIDANLRILDAQELTAIIRQVDIITDKAYVALKPFLTP